MPLTYAIAAVTPLQRLARPVGLALAILLGHTSASAAGVWNFDTSMGSARGQHAGVLLDDGSVAVLGGVNRLGFITGSERYAGGAWSSIGASGIAGNVAEAVTLGTGQVLVRTDGSLQARLYDPVANTWLDGGTQSVLRALPSMTLLPDGKVLVAGGGSAGGSQASAELFDPQTRSWTVTGSMAQARRAHAAVLLGSGRVLVVSGFDIGGEVPGAEIYDPATGTWSLVAPPLVPRHYASLTPLPDGRALLAGGFTATGVTTHAELYDPVSNTWTATGALNFPRNGMVGSPMAQATLLPTGRVLIAGGADGARNTQPVAELYDPATGSWAADSVMHIGRENGTAHLLPDGDVLVAGGFSSNPSLTFYAEVERYTPELPAGPQPVVNALPLLQRAGAALSLTGMGFTGGGGASTPILQLQRADNSALMWWPAASHTGTTFTSPPLGTLPAALYLARIVVDGIPSNATLVRLTDPPGTPVGTAGSAQVTVTWAPPANTGGNPPDGYTVTASPGGAGCSVAAPATRCTVTGLANGTPYTFTVQAQHPNGSGPVSSVSAAITPVAVIGSSPVPVPGLSPVGVALTALAAAALAGLGRKRARRRG